MFNFTFLLYSNPFYFHLLVKLLIFYSLQLINFFKLAIFRQHHLLNYFLSNYILGPLCFISY